MACERDRIIKLKEYLNSLGIQVNIGKNKARGQKGLFMHSFDNYRIDISRDVKNENVLSVILHEFAHFIHYHYDKQLKSLDFAFGDMSDDIKEELINVTVQDIPKDFASSLYNRKNQLSGEIKEISCQLKKIYPKFKLSEKSRELEKGIKSPLNYLLKYDRVNFAGRVYSTDKLCEYNLTNEQALYIILKTKQRALSRVKSKINRLNRYYNNPTELFARFTDMYFTKPELILKLAPKTCQKIKNTNIIYYDKIKKIFSEN